MAQYNPTGGKVQSVSKKGVATIAHSSGAARTTAQQKAAAAAASRAKNGTSTTASHVNALLGGGGGSKGAMSAGGGGGGYGGGGGGGYGGGGGDFAGMTAPVVAAPSEEDYLAGDSGFQTQNSALQAALQRFLADSDFQKQTYETDYNKSLRDLGYDEGAKTWNWNDKLTASGRGYQSQLDDFGARGMLQSSGYADAFNELQRMLGQQYESMSTGKTTFMSDLQNQIANYKGENTASSQAARAEALQRRAAQYQL